MNLPALHQRPCVRGLLDEPENTELRNGEWNKDGFRGSHLGRLVIFHVDDVVSPLDMPNSRRLHGTRTLSLPLVLRSGTFYSQLENFEHTGLRKILVSLIKALRQLVIKQQVQKPKVASNLCTWKRKQSGACKSGLSKPSDM